MCKKALANVLIIKQSHIYHPVGPCVAPSFIVLICYFKKYPTEGVLVS